MRWLQSRPLQSGALILGLGLLCPLLAEQGDADEKGERITGLPGMTVDLTRGEVWLKAKVCLTEGILEYAGVSTGGKTYESVFELDAEPSNIHAGLLLMGLDPIAMDPPSSEAGSALPLLQIRVHWEGAEREPEPLERLLVDRRTRTNPTCLHWRFTGSCFGLGMDGQTAYVADRERSVIAIWPDQTALLNMVEKSLNPYRGESFGYEVNSEAIRSKGTPCWLVISRVFPPTPVKGPRGKGS